MAIAWWKRSVFYQIYPRSFCDSNGDGIGDIPGIISKLDYLQDLGIEAIWLSPVYRSPNHDNGYDISDYFDINPEYGTLDDMHQLFAEATKRGIRIIMDLVINHTSDEHPWFIESQKSNSDYRDYYIWKDARYGLTGRRREPNNWLSYFTGPAWQWHEVRNQYYLHLFSPHQPDLNFHNPKVIEEIKKIMRFWLDMGAAGFRCDSINVIYKTSYKNGRFRLNHMRGSEHYFSQPGCHAILQELHRDVLRPYAAFAVGESSDIISIATAKQFITNEMNAFFTFDHLGVDRWGVPFLPRHYIPERLKQVLARWQEGLSWNTLFFENHDTQRSISKFGARGEHQVHSATLLATLLLTLKGTPFIFQGQEIGMENYPFKKIQQVQDVSTRSIYSFLRKCHVPSAVAFRLAMMICRDHVRTPMQWDASSNAGFSARKPWRPIHPNYVSINVASEAVTAGSTYQYYRQLLHLRRVTPALQHGDYFTIASDRDVFAYRRQLGEQSFAVVANMSDNSRRLPDVASKICVFTNYQDKNSSSQLLRPYEIMIFREGS